MVIRRAVTPSRFKQSLSRMPARWALLAVMALLGGALAGVLSLWRQGALRSAERRPPPAAPAPVSELRLTGILAAASVVNIPPPIDGTLETVMVNVGDEVYEHMLLARIRNSTIEAELQAAREHLEEAESQFNRLESVYIAERLETSRATADFLRVQREYEQAERAAQRQRILYREGATPRIVYEKAQAEFAAKQEEYFTAQRVARHAEDRLAGLRKELEAARRTVDDARQAMEDIAAEMEAAQIFSPVAGLVTGMAARQGEEVHVSMESLFQIATDLSRMQAIVEPPPPQLALIRPGQVAEIRIAELPGEALPGVVGEVTDRSAVIEFANPSPRVRPGLSAQVTIKVR